MSAAMKTWKQITALRALHRSIFPMTTVERDEADGRRNELYNLNRLYYKQVARSFVTLALAKCNEEGMSWWAVEAAGDGEELLENDSYTTVDDLVEWMTQCESGDLHLRNAHTGRTIFFTFVWQSCPPDELLADFGWDEGSEALANEFAQAYIDKHEE